MKLSFFGELEELNRVYCWRDIDGVESDLVLRRVHFNAWDWSKYEGQDSKQLSTVSKKVFPSTQQLLNLS